jgi:beta-alanine--pyruvate transaminase
LVRYLQRVRDICTQYGVIMVCDETITGFGRLGEYVLSRPAPLSTPPL